MAQIRIICLIEGGLLQGVRTDAISPEKITVKRVDLEVGDDDELTQDELDLLNEYYSMKHELY